MNHRSFHWLLAVAFVLASIIVGATRVFSQMPSSDVIDVARQDKYKWPAEMAALSADPSVEYSDPDYPADTALSTIVTVTSTPTPTATRTPTSTLAQLETDLESEAIMTQIPPLLSVTIVEIPDSGKHPKSGNPKLQGMLWELVDAHETDGPFAVQQVADNHVIKLQEDNRVLVVVEDDRGDVASLVQAIAESGVEIGTVASDRVSALVPISALKAIASLPEAAYVRLPLPMVQQRRLARG